MLPLTKKPYISAYAPRGITVSGPPSSLSRLRSSRDFENLRSTSIPVYGPYHSSILSSETDIEDILEGLPSSAASHPNRVPLISNDGTTAQGGDLGSLLKTAVGQILLHPIQWDSVIEELQTWLRTLNHSEAVPAAFSIVPIGSNQEHLIYTALEQTTLRSLVPSTAPPNASAPLRGGTDTNPKHPKLAIIGMSGRFPGAKDYEAFWNLLYQGLDVHKPVPSLRWDSKTHVDPTGKAKNTSATSFGCWLDDPEAFDNRCK